MANELEKFTQIMGSVDAQNAVRQIVDMFSSIENMSDKELLALAQTVDFFQGKSSDPSAVYNCKKIKDAIKSSLYHRYGGNVIMGSVQQSINGICSR